MRAVRRHRATVAQVGKPRPRNLRRQQPGAQSAGLHCPVGTPRRPCWRLGRADPGLTRTPGLWGGDGRVPTPWGSLAWPSGVPYQPRQPLPAPSSTLSRLSCVPPKPSRRSPSSEITLTQDRGHFLPGALREAPLNARREEAGPPTAPGHTRAHTRFSGNAVTPGTEAPGPGNLARHGRGGCHFCALSAVLGAGRCALLPCHPLAADGGRQLAAHLLARDTYLRQVRNTDRQTRSVPTQGS